MKRPHLTLADWLLIAGASWTILAFVIAVPIGRSMKRADDVQRAVYPPPVPPPLTPPFSQTLPDASWFDGMPVDVLSDDAVHSLFDELIDIEGLS